MYKQREQTYKQRISNVDRMETECCSLPMFSAAQSLRSEQNEGNEGITNMTNMNEGRKQRGTNKTNEKRTRSKGRKSRSLCLRYAFGIRFFCNVTLALPYYVFSVC